MSEFRFPSIPARQWWAIRSKFQQSLPSKVTPSYLAAALDMKENSAKANVIPSLVFCGLLADDGTPTELAKRWREDSEYATVCKEMSASIYPGELRDAAPGPDVDRAAVERWFRNHTGFGIAAARRLALVFSLVQSGALPQDASPQRSRSSVAPPVRKVQRPKSSIATKEKSTKQHNVAVAPANGQRPSFEPAVNLNIQIHVSPDTSAEQIDQIFESMSRHLYPNS